MTGAGLAFRYDSWTQTTAMRSLCAVLAATHSASHLERAVQAVADWDAVVDLASRHAVDGLVTNAVRSVGFVLPSHVGTRLAHLAFLRSIRYQRTLDATLLVLDALATDGISALSLKGAILADRYYDDPVSRPSKDVDVLVVGADLDRAMSTLERLGFESLETPERVRLHRRYDHAVTLVNGQLDIVVELHFHAYRVAGALLGAAPLLERSRRHAMRAGATVSVLSAEDELLYLAAHAAGNFDVSLRLLYDLRLVLERGGPIDWNTVVARAKSTGTLKALRLTMADLEQFLGVRVEHPEFDHRSGRVAAAMSGLRCRSAADDIPRSLKSLTGVVTAAMLADSASALVASVGSATTRIGRRWIRNRLPRIAPANWDV